MFSTLTSGCRFDAKQREQQSRLFRGDPSSSKAQRESADLGSLDFFGGADAKAAAAAASAKDDDEVPAEKSSRAARRRRARKAVEAEAEAADTPAPVPEALPAADAVSEALSEREQADANALRRALRIHVYGTNPPAPVQSATEMADRFEMRPALRRNVLEAGYHELTRVQMQSVPTLMARRDLVACAPTGSGKTAAFAIPLLAQLGAPKRAGLRAVVLAPTQELARQTYREFLKLAAGASLGVCVLTKKLAASAATAQKGQALRRYDVMVCTPLRLVSLLEKEVVSLHTVTSLVMDEADKLLELGFLSQVDTILASCTHTQLQRACFSATMMPAVEDLATTVLKDAVRVVVGDKNAANEQIEQKLVFCGREDGKLLALRSMVREGLTPPVLIFVQSKERAVQLFNELVYDNLNVDVMHAERSQARARASAGGVTPPSSGWCDPLSHSGVTTSLSQWRAWSLSQWYAPSPLPLRRRSATPSSTSSGRARCGC